MRPFFVYLLRCSDGSYYCGQTDNLETRLQQHEAGEHAYSATRKPVELVWHGEFESRHAAIAFEQQVKGWSRAKKEALIAGDWERVRHLAKSRTQADTTHLPKSSGAGLRQAQPERTSGASTMKMPSDASQLADVILGPQDPSRRRAIAKAITLLESTRADHRLRADRLLARLLPHAGGAFRLGLSGVPGVGKSTLIEALGLHLIDRGLSVAVLTIDPSSAVSGGSILGDKTRMEKLSVHEKAYIRPSPSSGTLGGVAEKTREAMLVLEAAGYDVVIVETVGVGQSEVAVAGMTDMFVLMQLPNAGDELQAIKKGVMEMADLVLINKADLDPDAASRARAQITSSLRLLGQHGNPQRAEHDKATWHPRVLQLSALSGQGVDGLWTAAQEFRELREQSGAWASRRRQQALAWMWERIEAGLRHAFRADPQVRAHLGPLSQQVADGTVVASVAARSLLGLFHPAAGDPAYRSAEPGGRAP